MSIAKTNDIGTIFISSDVIATIVGVSLKECYGVVGMASIQKIKDGVSEILKKENYKRGIDIKVNTDETIDLHLHIIIFYGVKIQEVCRIVQEKIAFSLKEHLDLDVNSINIKIEGIKVDN